MDQPIPDWIGRDRLPGDLYELLGRRRFDPDTDGLRAAVLIANRQWRPFQNHRRPEVILRARALLDRLGLAEITFGDSAKHAAYDRDLIQALAENYARRQGGATRSWSVEPLRSWLAEEQDVHPARLERILDALLPPDPPRTVPPRPRPEGAGDRAGRPQAGSNGVTAPPPASVPTPAVAREIPSPADVRRTEAPPAHGGVARGLADAPATVHPFPWVPAMPARARSIAWAVGATASLAIVAALRLLGGPADVEHPVAPSIPGPVIRPDSSPRVSPVTVQPPAPTPVVPLVAAPSPVEVQTPGAEPSSPSPPPEAPVASRVVDAPKDGASLATPGKVEDVPPVEAELESLAVLRANLSKRDFSGRKPYTVMHQVPDAVSVLLKEGEGQRRVALAGINPPENVHPGLLGKAFGKQSREFLKGLAADEAVYIESDRLGQTDHAGRPLVLIFRASDGLFINLEMVAGGYGFAADDPSFPYREPFKRFQANASEAERGLWNPAARRGVGEAENGEANLRRLVEIRRQRDEQNAPLKELHRQQLNELMQTRRPGPVFPIPAGPGPRTSGVPDLRDLIPNLSN
jgi:endonuclease YncB( thermonuclease family)